MQQDDFKEIVKEYSELAFNNKAIHQEYSAKET